MNTIYNLFIAFFRVGALSIGGGYTLIPLIEREVVFNYHWLTKDEFLEILGITQGIPGAISMKFATYAGYKEAGILGVLAANIGILLPPVIGVMILYSVFNKISVNPGFKAFLTGIKFGTIGLLLAFAMEMAKSAKWGFNSVLILILSFLSLYFKIHPGLVIILSGLLGLVIL